MKLKNLLYLLLALPLAFASCSDILGDEKEPAKTPKLTVTSSLTVELEADGGSGIITYTLENAPEGAQVSATCEADWVSDLTVGAMITYKFSKNDGDARDTKIVVSYEQQVVEVSLTQAAKPASTVLRFEVTSEPTIEFDCNAFSGSIGYILENPIEGVEVAAVSNQDWVEVTAIADGAIDFTAQANEGEAREATITITYGILDPVVITLKQAQYVDPSAVIIPFGVVDCWASSENGGKQWDVTFVEHDATLGDMQTRISFSLAEANVQRVTDGTYSVADGTILLNTAVENGYSTYRYNSSELVDIIDATFTVSTNTRAKTITINGTFKAGDKNVEIKYRGQMRGMDLGEAVIGAIEYNEWASANSTWCNTNECLFTLKSADGNFSIVIDIYHSGASKIIPAGTYDVKENVAGLNDFANRGTEIIYNSVDAGVATGSVVIEHISGGYKITFDIMDDIDRNFKGCYEGPIAGYAQNPA